MMNQNRPNVPEINNGDGHGEALTTERTIAIDKL